MCMCVRLISLLGNTGGGIRFGYGLDWILAMVLFCVPVVALDAFSAAVCMASACVSEYLPRSPVLPIIASRGECKCDAVPA